MNKTTATIIFACAATALNAQTALYDFNSYTSGVSGSINDLTYNSGDPGVFPFAGQGLGGSQSIQGPTFSGTSGFSLVPTAGAVSLNTGSDFTLTQSVYFRTAADVSGLTDRDNRDPVMLGLTNLSSQVTPNSIYGFNSDSLNVSVRVTDNDTRAFRFFGTNTDISNGSDTFGTLTGTQTGTLVADSWHLFTAAFAYDSINDEWNITARVQETDANGSIVATGLDLSDTLTASANVFEANPSLYGYLAGDESKTAGIDHFDNATLVAVPEPSTYALLAGALALGSIMTRRRK